MIILGWILFILNIIFLFFLIYKLQLKVNIGYVFAAGIALAQIIYIAKTLKVLKKFEISRAMLDSAAKEAGISMTKILRGKKEGDKP